VRMNLGADLVAALIEDAVVRLRPTFHREVYESMKDYFPEPTIEDLTDSIFVKSKYDTLKELNASNAPLLLEHYLHYKCSQYLERIYKQLFKYLIEDKIKSRVKESLILLIIGAGFSVAAGAPLTRHLDSLLMNLEVKGFEELVKSAKDKEFKNRFIRSIESNPEVFKVTVAHKKVADAFICKKIIEIISLNWDNIIENESGKKELRKINREGQTPIDEDGDGFLHYLWKLNGDVEDVDYDWIFPDMQERIFKSFLEYTQNLKKNVLLLLIIGYSERDEKGVAGNSRLCKEVIEPLSKVLKTYRIGMDLSLLDKYDDYIVAPAEVFVPFILDS
jgi:hypothetical protein